MKDSDKLVSTELWIDGSSGSPELERHMAQLMKELFELWKVKQLSYGPHNISTFGLKGVVVRLWDKLQRIVRLTWMGVSNPLQDESIRDTLLDVADYGLIGVLVLDGNWPDSNMNIDSKGSAE